MDIQDQQIKSDSSSESLSPVQKKSYRKFVLSFLAIIIALFVGYPILRTLYNDYFSKRGFDAYFSAEQDYLNALKNDQYGGKIPQETYFMYLDALKKGDILLASKYYIGVEGPGRAYKWLTHLQQKEWFEEYIDELPTEWAKMREKEYWDPDVKKFSYDYILKKDRVVYEFITGEGASSTFPAGKYEGSILFQFSEPAQIWKLYQK